METSLWMNTETFIMLVETLLVQLMLMPLKEKHNCKMAMNSSLHEDWSKF
jgi:hypothetical protein